MSQLEEIKVRAEKATPGPWQMDPETHHLHDTAEDPIAFDFVDEDAALFIAHARTDVPKLIAALEAVEALHRPDAETGKCEECTYARFSAASVRYPCPTVRAITEALQ